MRPPKSFRYGLAILGFAGVLISGCAPSYTLVNNPRARAAGETFGYRHWVSSSVEPDIVMIGIHGFCGASIDYENLGLHLLKNQPKTALYAYEVRGQGNDPIKERRGDIGDPEEWYNDLQTFTRLVRKQHPRAKIVWFGESMGSLIAAHALSEAPSNDPPCDAIVLSSPVVRFKDGIPAWQPALLRMAAATVPSARISLETLTGGKDVQMTQTSTHEEQSLTNSYYIDEYTLRLLNALARNIDTMNDCAEKIDIPLLVLHGGQDFFNTDSDMRGFIAHVPEKVTYHNYPKAYHLLMYDQEKDRIFRDVEKWLTKVRNDQF
ncbi:alpha/beta fold hydrolase [Luteolibacter pohnpeiensis]|uniref:alpha/beta fold hydrolase n=1 Tax=Luteolibacter pohnpeiensis TaxID=454153 RepID=UPI001906BFC7|nr:alpha/beta fold hydrolase [Luteolibacter pohnpeiensis]